MWGPQPSGVQAPLKSSWTKVPGPQHSGKVSSENLSPSPQICRDLGPGMGHSWGRLPPASPPHMVAEQTEASRGPVPVPRGTLC